MLVLVFTERHWRAWTHDESLWSKTQPAAQYVCRTEQDVNDASADDQASQRITDTLPSPSQRCPDRRLEEQHATMLSDLQDKFACRRYSKFY